MAKLNFDRRYGAKGLRRPFWGPFGLEGPSGRSFTKIGSSYTASHLLVEPLISYATDRILITRSYCQIECAENEMFLVSVFRVVHVDRFRQMLT